jgi:glycosyltransferase involved in cell wall biosynthesis
MSSADSKGKNINPYAGQGRLGRSEGAAAPVVSVIVVMYRDREELGRLLDNLGPFRTGGRLEVVVIDGGSDDGTVELLSARGGEVDYWISEPDAGIYDAMNKGVALARGRYVIHMNAGDRLLAVPWEHLPDRPDGPAWVSCQVKEDSGIFQPRLSWVSWYANTNHHQGSFFRRDVHLGYKADYRVYGDFEHHLRLLCAGARPTLVHELVAEHCGGGISADTQWNTEEARAVRENLGRVHALLPRLMVPVRRFRARFSRLLGATRQAGICL